VQSNKKTLTVLSWSLGNRATHVMNKWREQNDACGEDKLTAQ